MSTFDVIHSAKPSRPWLSGLVLCAVVSFTGQAANQNLYHAGCSGAGGYCRPGDILTLKYLSGGAVVIPPPPTGTTHYNPPEIVVAYSKKGGGGFERALLRQTAISDTLLYGGHTWLEAVPYVEGQYVLADTLPPNDTGTWCISVTINAWGYGGFYGYPGLVFGESEWKSNFENDEYCVADAPPPPPPASCYHDLDTDLDVDFGVVSPGSITAAQSGENTREKTLHIVCSDTETHEVTVTLKMAPTSWDDSQISMSHPNLGVRMSKGGQPVSNNGSFGVSVTSSGSVVLSFSLLRNPQQPPGSIAAGQYSGSAVLVLDSL